MKEESGIRRMLWLSHDLDNLAEDTRISLGMNRSCFYRFCVLKTLDSLNVLATKVKESINNES